MSTRPLPRRAAGGRPERRWYQPTWRVGTVAAFFATGALVVTSALSSDGLDLRESPVSDLSSVVRAEQDRVEQLQDRVADLSAEIEGLSRAVDDTAVNTVRSEVQEMRRRTGFTDAVGPGLTVVLDDAPKEAIRRAAAEGVSAEELVVHQQDIQAVVNAFWAGGAQAISLQDRRIISTTGIKCVGNTVVLHGVPYSPPYRISAIGDLNGMFAALEKSASVAAYRSYVDTHQLGYEVTAQPRLEIPAYGGPATLTHARAG